MKTGENEPRKKISEIWCTQYRLANPMAKRKKQPTKSINQVTTTVHFVCDINHKQMLRVHNFNFELCIAYGCYLKIKANGLKNKKFPSDKQKK